MTYKLSESDCFVTCTRCKWKSVEKTSNIFSVVRTSEGVNVESDEVPCPRCNFTNYFVSDIDSDSKEAYDIFVGQREWKEYNFQLLLDEEQEEVLEHNYHQLQLEFLL